MTLQPADVLTDTIVERAIHGHSEAIGKAFWLSRIGQVVPSLHMIYYPCQCQEEDADAACQSIVKCQMKDILLCGRAGEGNFGIIDLSAGFCINDMSTSTLHHDTFFHHYSRVYISQLFTRWFPFV